MLVLKTLNGSGRSTATGSRSLYSRSRRLSKVEEGRCTRASANPQKGLVTAEWVRLGQAAHRIYHLTPEGREQLDAELSEYRRVSQAIGRVIEPA